MEKKIQIMGKKEIENSNIVLVYVEAVLMGNGELINNGKTIGWADDVGKIYKEITE